MQDKAPTVSAEPTVVIAAKETSYGGCRFRSRAEARWAVFFDALRIEWRYEIEAYDIAGKGYLPDFWLPGLRCWAEVKGVLDEATMTHLVAAADAGGLPADPTTGRAWEPGDGSARILLLGSDMPLPSHNGRVHTRLDLWRGEVFTREVAFKTVIDVGTSEVCGQMLPIGEWAPLVSYGERTEHRLFWAGTLRGHEHGWLCGDEHVKRAYVAARQARFEHGESGAPVNPVPSDLVPVDTKPRRTRRAKVTSDPTAVAEPVSSGRAIVVVDADQGQSPFRPMPEPPVGTRRRPTRRNARTA